ncbi:MAG: tripartite tricarboxylate transporter substrate binding protein [Betaproteobacteria bacterium]
MSKTFLVSSMMLLALAAAPEPVLAQGFPAQPIRLISGGAAGGGWDLAARLLAERMKDDLGHAVIVDTRPGADGILAANAVAAAAPDGYTLLPAVTSVMIMNPVVHDKLSYEPLRDFEPISLVGIYPLVMAVNPAVPAKTLKELIALAKDQPGKLNYGSANSAYTFATEVFMQQTGASFYRIPYKGSAQTVTALVAGDVQVALIDAASALPQIKSGRIRALAVASPRRPSFLPDTPTMAEAGLSSYELMLWIGMFAPARTPHDVIARLHTSIERSLQVPEFRERLTNAGVLPMSTTPDELRDLVRRDLAQAREITKLVRMGAE